MCQDKASYTRQLVNAVTTFTELLQLIKDTFEKYPKGYKLSSIHRAKGLEAMNVFILNPPIELEMAMNHPIGRIQEGNLHFVGLTRSSRNLYWVTK
jgi:superfamily I DNA/RNA helicase